MTSAKWPDLPEQVTVASVMTCNVETAIPQTPLAEVLECMASRRISCVIVEEKRRPVGVFSERDAVRMFSGGDKEVQGTVGEVMISPVTCVEPDTPLSKVAETMTTEKCRRLPVVDGKGLVIGLVTQTDVQAGLREQLAKYTENLEHILERRTEELRSMSDIADKIARFSRELMTLDMKEVLDIGAQQIPRMLGARSACFVLPDTNGGHVVAKECGPTIACERLVERIANAEESVAIESCAEADGHLVSLSFDLPKLNCVTGTPEEGKTEKGGVCLHVADRSVQSKEFMYAASMIRDILGANIANAMLFSATRKVSRLDSLTGLKRRYVFDEALDDACCLFARYERPSCVALIDIDRFKDINDRWGHDFGDRALAGVADIIRHSLRTIDIVARYGGDEFAVILPQTRTEQAAVALERLRVAISRWNVGMEGPEITVSIGYVSLRAGDSPADVLKRSDIALYQAKKQGRNQVCCSTEQSATLSLTN